MRKIVDLLIGTCVIWLPVLGIIVASKLAEIITGEMIMKFFMVLGVLSIITVILVDRRS